MWCGVLPCDVVRCVDRDDEGDGSHRPVFDIVTGDDQDAQDHARRDVSRPFPQTPRCSRNKNTSFQYPHPNTPLALPRLQQDDLDARPPRTRMSSRPSLYSRFPTDPSDLPGRSGEHHA